ncbi:MAG: carbonic anhydrase [Bacilli bacterium]|nr:carbonic anhydrase [Bacilli bacterium]
MSELERLLKGNEAFVNPKAAGDVARIRREELAANGQHPFAAVVTCSDSRVPPEQIFSCGLGDLFVIRVAGNVIGEDELASIHYAVSHLHVGLVAILGHTHCGAVGAVLSGHEEEELKPLTDKIKEAIGDERDERRASIKNATHAAEIVKTKLNLSDGCCKAMLYDIVSGRVEVL